jgi:hypothetical protein
MCNAGLLGCAAMTLIGAAAVADPVVGKTDVLGPFTGPQAKLHPDNVSPLPIAYYGTDLGFSYGHQGQIRFLFGDTIANDKGEPIQASTAGRYDDMIGSVDLAQWNQPEKFSKENIPVIKLPQNPDSTETAALNPGHALELFKTPVGGFSNGEREFGVFFTYKPKGCTTDSDCLNGSSCDTDLGYIDPAWDSEEGLTFGCVDGSSPQCHASTLSDASGKPTESGLCVDRSASNYSGTPMGRIGAVSVKNLIGMRDRADPRRYSRDHEWYTSKFMNPSIRTVSVFEPPQAGKPFKPDYRPAQVAGGQARVFIWGRPHFIAVNKVGRTLSQYFAYVDLPADAGYSWKPQYFSGLDAAGLPMFSPNEADAKPVDMDASKPGVQTADEYDIVNQTSLAWVPQLDKWVMFFGGGVLTTPLPPALPNCGILELFAGRDCKLVNVGNGAFRMRTADNPWGPWSSAQTLIAEGDSTQPKGMFGPGGMLYHPDCKDPNCAPIDRAPERVDREVGYFYAPNIVEQWIRPAGDGVDIIWNASTWAPYRVILLRTHVSRGRTGLNPDHPAVESPADHR